MTVDVLKHAMIDLESPIDPEDEDIVDNSMVLLDDLRLPQFCNIPSQVDILFNSATIFQTETKIINPINVTLKYFAAR
jgi:hypothetical protein